MSLVRPPRCSYLLEDGSLLGSSHVANEESVRSELWNQGLGPAMPLISPV